MNATTKQSMIKRLGGFARNLQSVGRQGRTSLAGLLAGVFLSAASVTHAAFPIGSPAAQNGRLSVCGTTLCSEAGDPIQLRGVSSHGLSWYGSYMNAQSIKWMESDWGIDIVRGAMYTMDYNGYVEYPNYQSTLEDKIDEMVNAAEAAGVYMIIDWHILKDANPQTNQAQAITFFKKMATKYKNKTHVLYEICNEPNGTTTWAQIKSYANAVIPAIRAIDPNGIIIVGTPNWSQWVSHAADNPITGYSNIMYTLHFYAGTHGQSLRDEATYALSKKLPIFVTEWGMSVANGGVTSSGANDNTIYKTEAANWIKFMRDKKISWCNWSITDKSESSAALKPGASPTGNWTTANLTPSGIFVRDSIRNPPDQFTPPPGPFTITYKPMVGGTITPDVVKTLYPRKDTVVLTAVPATGYRFVGWTDDCIDSTENTCTLPMYQNYTVGATFTQATITLTQPANATIQSNPVAGAGNKYAIGAPVTFTLTPNTLGNNKDSVYRLLKWSGVCAAVTTNSCEITVGRDTVVSASVAKYYRLNLVKSDSGSINMSVVSPDSMYIGGQSVRLTPAPKEGFAFLEWTGNCAVFNARGSDFCNLSMSAAKSAGIKYAKQMKLTINATNGTVTTAPTAANGGYYAQGGTVTLTATANTGYVFAGWTGACSGITPTCQVTMDTEKTVGANFVEPVYYALTTSATNGTLSTNVAPTDKGYANGTTVIVTPKAADGYGFKAWSGACTGNTPTCTVVMDDNKSVVAEFEVVPYFKILANPVNGTISSNPVATASGYASGTSVTLTATPADGYAFAGWTDSCKGTNNTCVLVMNNEKVVGANFTKVAYFPLTITSSAGGTVGTSPTATASGFASGTEVTLTAQPLAGYQLSAWSGACAGSTFQCVVKMDAAKSVTATFVKNSNFMINVVAKNGTVMTNPIQTTSGFAPNASVTVTATPASGYVFVNWSGDCAGSTPSCALVMTSNKTVTANFQLSTEKFKLTQVSKDSGNLVCEPASTDSLYASGTVVKITPVPKPGYSFDSWIGSCTGVGPCAVTMTQARKVTAVFTRNRYALTTKATNGKIALAPDSATYASRTVVVAQPVANVGYKFKSWAGPCTGSDTLCTFKMDSAITLEAIFEVAKRYSITLPAANSIEGGKIVVSPDSATYFEGSILKFTAVASDKYKFSKWTGSCAGQTTNVCTIRVDSATTVSVEFTQTTGLSEKSLRSTNGRLGVYSQGRNANVTFDARGLGRAVVFITNINGGERQLLWSGTANSLRDLAIPEQGSNGVRLVVLQAASGTWTSTVAPR